VPAQREEPLLRVPMSWQQYLELPERPKAEWVDGVAVILNAPPRFDHGSAAAQLILLLGPLFPSHYVVTEVFLRLPRNRVRLPDVMLTGSRPDDGWVSEPPPMVSEVLSGSTRSEDMVRKSVEYAEAGIGQYWLVDPELRTIEVMGNVGGVWEVLARVDDDHPDAEVELEGVPVPIDLGQLLRV
jgi:Uma2 family endonuclease